MLQCRSGYVVSFDETVKGWIVRFANGSVANRSELADFVLAPYLEVEATFPWPLFRIVQGVCPPTVDPRLPLKGPR